MLGIIILLGKLQGQAQLGLPLSISLNTLVSFLGVAFKASLLTITSSRMGQLKWHWFSRERNLTDFETLNEAGHKSWAAFRLLASRKPYQCAY